jgi:hypothetical protein
MRKNAERILDLRLAWSGLARLMREAPGPVLLFSLLRQQQPYNLHDHRLYNRYLIVLLHRVHCSVLKG